MSLDTVLEDTWNALHQLLGTYIGDVVATGSSALAATGDDTILAAGLGTDVILISKGNWAALDKGKSAVVLSYPNGWEMLDGAHGVFRVRWRFVLEVYVRHDNIAALGDLAQIVDRAIAVLLRYPTLESHPGVSLVRPQSADSPRWIFDRAGGGPHYVMQAIHVHIVQQVAISGGQYG